MDNVIKKIALISGLVTLLGAGNFQKKSVKCIKLQCIVKYLMSFASGKNPSHAYGSHPIAIIIL